MLWKEVARKYTQVMASRWCEGMVARVGMVMSSHVAGGGVGATTARSANVDQTGRLLEMVTGMQAMAVEVGKMEQMIDDLVGVDVMGTDDLRMDDDECEELWSRVVGVCRIMAEDREVVQVAARLVMAGEWWRGRVQGPSSAGLSMGMSMKVLMGGSCGDERRAHTEMMCRRRRRIESEQSAKVVSDKGQELQSREPAKVGLQVQLRMAEANRGERHDTVMPQVLIEKARHVAGVWMRGLVMRDRYRGFLRWKRKVKRARPGVQKKKKAKK